MPPKLRRPAAVAPRARVRARRPAAEGEAVGRAGGEIITCADISLAQCRTLTDIEVVEGSYWEEALQAALRVREVHLRGEDLLLKGQVLGTQNEALLRAATALPERVVDVHLCGAGCSGTPHAEGLIHVKRLRVLGEHREGWMSNAVPGHGGAREGDELADLRRDKGRLGGAGYPGPGVEAVVESPSRQKKEEKRSRSRRKRKKADLKIVARKEVTAVLKDTGADPDPGVRKRFRRKAAKLARQKRTRSSSSGSSSSESGLSGAAGDTTLFGSSSKIQIIGRKLPGALVAAAVGEAGEALLLQDGEVWEPDAGPLPPLFSKYFRQQLATRMSPAMAREAQTICQALAYAAVAWRRWICFPSGSRPWKCR